VNTVPAHGAIHAEPTVLSEYEDGLALRIGSVEISGAIHGQIHEGPPAARGDGERQAAAGVIAAQPVSRRVEEPHASSDRCSRGDRGAHGILGDQIARGARGPEAVVQWNEVAPVRGEEPELPNRSSRIRAPALRESSAAAPWKSLCPRKSPLRSNATSAPRPRSSTRRL